MQALESCVYSDNFHHVRGQRRKSAESFTLSPGFNMVPIFNISSTGATATAWLTGLLNLHPSVVCFHGLRHDPFTDGKEPLSGASLYDGLMSLRHRVRQRPPVTFGLIHSFSGPEVRPELIDRDGSFMAILREPLSRIHSLFINHYTTLHKQNMDVEDDVYQLVEERHQISSLETLYTPFFPCNADTMTPIEWTFYALCKDTMANDLANYTLCPRLEVVRYEDITKDPDYLHTVLKRLLQDELEEFRDVIIEYCASDAYRGSRSFSIRRTPDDLFIAWPEQFKRLFLAAAGECGIGDVIDLYFTAGYSLPESLLTWIEEVKHQPYSQMHATLGH